MHQMDGSNWNDKQLSAFEMIILLVLMKHSTLEKTRSLQVTS